MGHQTVLVSSWWWGQYFGLIQFSIFNAELNSALKMEAIFSPETLYSFTRIRQNGITRMIPVSTFTHLNPQI
jgi:hypothetical protein